MYLYALIKIEEREKTKHEVVEIKSMIFIDSLTHIPCSTEDVVKVISRG